MIRRFEWGTWKVKVMNLGPACSKPVISNPIIGKKGNSSVEGGCISFSGTICSREHSWRRNIIIMHCSMFKWKCKLVILMLGVAAFEFLLPGRTAGVKILDELWWNWTLLRCSGQGSFIMSFIKNLKFILFNCT